MSFNHVVSVLVLRGVPHLYTYGYPFENPVIGSHVTIPFGRASATGVIVDILANSDQKNVKPVTGIDEKKPTLPQDLIRLILWVSSTYQVSFYTAYQCVVGARKYRDLSKEKTPIPSPDTKPELNPDDWPTLTDEQSQVFSAISAMFDRPNADKPNEALIHGVTGSGKTELYLNLSKSVIQAGQSVIVLVPEIALTPQLSQAFIERFGDFLTVLHSGLTPKQKDVAWNTIHSGSSRIVLGPRSAIFSPVKRLGLIIIDEEHDTAYKQESSPRYNVIDIARQRARELGCLIVKGSATPSLESYHGAEQPFEMLSRVHKTKMPDVKLVDLKEQEPAFRLFSKPLIDAMNTTLDKQKKIMLLVNRRGFAPYISCQSCGHIHVCPNCELSYTYHSDKSFRCHRCFKKTPMTHECSACKKPTLKFSGTGIQKIEYECRRLFPEATIYRLDKDTGSTAKKITAVLEGFRSDGDILIGTQMIAKGHHIEHVHLVGILAIDNQLNIPDFRSTEKTFQLITQVAGRAGRDKEQGEVFVQTSQPNHYVFDYAKHHDFKNFYTKESGYRKMLNYPPYSKLINIIFSSKSQKSLSIYLKDVRQFLAPLEKMEGIQIFGPSSAPVERINTYYRWHVLIKSTPKAYSDIHKALESIPRIKYVRTIIDFEPVSVL